MEQYLYLYHNGAMKFKRAVFCYYVVWFDPDMHAWLMLVCESRKYKGLRPKTDNKIENIANWAVDILLGSNDLDTIIRMLVGDEYVEKNKRDIAKLEREVKKSIFDLWDTDPIFSKYSHLKTLARNREFEKMWAKKKQK